VIYSYNKNQKDALFLKFNFGKGLYVFENRVLRRVFGPKREEITGEWRKLHNEELNDLYSVPTGSRTTGT
jgi:hypothetical protein